MTINQGIHKRPHVILPPYHDVEMLIPVPSDYSFPSDLHFPSLYAQRLYVLFPRVGFFICMIFTCNNGFSRLYLFVHYLELDVTFAIVLGISVGIIVMLF